MPYCEIPDEVMDKMEYSYVAFLDILGFKNMIFDDMNKVYLALNKVKEFSSSYCNVTNSMTDISIDVLPKATMFSDSVVISIPESDCYLEQFVKIVSKLQYELLKDGILLRGGIELGYIFHDNYFVFGESLVKAYLLECETAKYPRIMISEEAVRASQDFKNDEFSNSLDFCMEYDDDCDEAYPDAMYDFAIRIEDVAQKDNEGKYFVDYLFNGMYEDMENGRKEDILKVRSFIENGLSINSDKIREKYIWLEEYYNQSISRHEIALKKQLSKKEN